MLYGAVHEQCQCTHPNFKRHTYNKWILQFQMNNQAYSESELFIRYCIIKWTNTATARYSMWQTQLLTLNYTAGTESGNLIISSRHMLSDHRTGHAVFNKMKYLICICRYTKTRLLLPACQVKADRNETSGNPFTATMRNDSEFAYELNLLLLRSVLLRNSSLTPLTSSFAGWYEIGVPLLASTPAMCPVSLIFVDPPKLTFATKCSSVALRSSPQSNCLELLPKQFRHFSNVVTTCTDGRGLPCRRTLVTSRTTACV